MWFNEKINKLGWIQREVNVGNKMKVNKSDPKFKKVKVSWEQIGIIFSVKIKCLSAWISVIYISNRSDTPVSSPAELNGNDFL